MASNILNEWDASMDNSKSAPFNQGDYDGIQDELHKLLNNVYHVPGENMSNLKDSDIERYMDRYPGIEFIYNELGDGPEYDKEVAELIYNDIYKELYSADAVKEQQKKWKSQDNELADLYGNKKKGLNEKRLLEEFPPSGGEGTESEEIAQLDQVQLFQDLADLDGSLSEAFAKFYVYKKQVINNPNIKQALSKIRLSINELIKQVTYTMSGMGIENDSQPEDTLEDL